MKIKKMMILAQTLAIALVLAYVESIIPFNFSIPGMKVGLANIAVVFALYRLGIAEAIAVSFLRMLVLFMMFGNGVSLLYSFEGAIVSLTLMFIFKKLNVFSIIGVSVIGAVGHNAGQIIAACILLETTVVRYYFPALVITGVITGIIIGILAGVVTDRIKIS